MNIHEELWTAFGDIIFNESDHSYTDSNNTKYTSATTWIKQFEADVDWEVIKEKKAVKLGISKEELSEKWKYNSDYATNLGTQCHSVMEFLWNKKNYNFDERLNSIFPEMKEDFEWRKKNVCIPLFNKMKKIYTPVANEFIVYDQKAGVCGTIDFIAFNKKTGNYAIIDWKTSKTFDITNNFNNTMKYPFNYIDDCNTAHYSLQLSLYKAILEKHTSLKITDLILFQIPGKSTLLPEVYKCLDLSEKVKQILWN